MGGGIVEYKIYIDLISRHFLSSSDVFWKKHFSIRLEKLRIQRFVNTIPSSSNRYS